MAYIMKFLINLLLFNRRMFKNLINDVIKSYLLKHQNKLGIQSNGLLYRIDTLNSFMCDLNNLNLDYLALDGGHNKIILPTFQYNKNSGIIKDSICFFSKKSNDGFDGDEKDINNLDSFFKSQESLMNNLQTIIAKLETLSAGLDPKEMNEIKETLMTCLQMLQSNIGKDKNIEELINQEIKQCRVVRKETMEFIDEISRYLKQIDSKEEQSTAYFNGHDFVDNKSTESKSEDNTRSADKNQIGNKLVLRRPRPAQVNKTILDSKNNPVGHYKGTTVTHINEHDIKINESKLSDNIIKFKSGDIILERIISDRKSKKSQSHGDKDQKSTKINKSSTAVIPITENSEIMEIVPPFETFEILQGKIQHFPTTNITALQVIEQPIDSKTLELDDEFVKKLDHTILFERNCNDLVEMFQMCCNQSKKQTSKELVSKFNQDEIEYVCRNLNMKDCDVTKIIEEYYKNIDLWWQRQQDYKHACRLLEMINRHFEKSEREINSKLPEKWQNLIYMENYAPTQSEIVENKSEASQTDNLSQQDKVAVSKDIKSKIQNVSNVKETVKITKTENRAKVEKIKNFGTSPKTATLQGSSTPYNKPNLSIQNIKSAVQITDTANKEKDEKSKEFGTTSRITSLSSSSTNNKPNLVTQNVKPRFKITDAAKDENGKEIGTNFKISNLQSPSITYNGPNLSSQNYQNVKPAKMSETEPSITAKFVTQNEQTKSTSRLVNIKEKSANSAKKELVSSLLKIPFKVSPNQNQFPNQIKSQTKAEKPQILKEKPPIQKEKSMQMQKHQVQKEQPMQMQKHQIQKENPAIQMEKTPIQTEKSQIKTEKPPIQTEKPEIQARKPQRERTSATKRIVGARLPTQTTTIKTNKTDPKASNNNDKNSRSFSQIRKSYSTTDLKEQIEVTKTKQYSSNSETNLNKLKLIEQIKLKTNQKSSDKNLNKPKLKEEIKLTKIIQQSFTNLAKNSTKPKLKEPIKLTKTSQSSTSSETILNKPKMKVANNRLKRQSSWLIERMGAFEMIPSRSYHEKSVKDDKHRETKSVIMKLQPKPENQPISDNTRENLKIKK